MGYKALGFAVWHGAKWYLRRRYGGTPRKVGIGLLVASGIVAAIAAQRKVRAGG